LSLTLKTEATFATETFLPDIVSNLEDRSDIHHRSFFADIVSNPEDRSDIHHRSVRPFPNYLTSQLRIPHPSERIDSLMPNITKTFVGPKERDLENVEINFIMIMCMTLISNDVCRSYQAYSESIPYRNITHKDVAH
jgi:hypothetical protein